MSNEIDGGESTAGSNAGKSLRTRAIDGSLIVSISYVTREAIRMVSNLALTRLLTPEAFGLMAIVNAVLQGIAMFGDVGITSAVVRSTRGDEKAFTNTAWTLQAARGLFLWILCIAVAPFVARFYKDERLLPILMITGGTALLSGLRPTVLLRMERHMRVGVLAAIDIGAIVGAAVLMVTWAYLVPSVWALVAGGIVIALVPTACGFYLSRTDRDRVAWDKPAVSEILTFGRWLFVGVLLLFVATQSDRLIFGRTESLATLGVYNLAAVLVNPPIVLMGRLGNAIAFPALSRKHEERDPDGFARAYDRARGPLLLLGGVMVALLLSCGPWLIRVLYDSRWHAASWIVSWLAVSTWLRVLVTPSDAALLARGHSGWLAAANAGKVAAIPVGVGLGAWLAGFPGAVAGFALSDLARWAIYSAANLKIGLPGPRADVRPTLHVAASAMTGALLAWWVARAGAHPVLSLFAAGIGTSLVYAPSAWRFRREELSR